MQPLKLKVKPMTAENSARFGVLASLEGTSPAFSDKSFNFTKHLAVIEPFSENVSLSMVEAFKEANGITPILENHSRTKEIIIPTGGDVVLILAEGKGKPDIQNAQALRLSCGQAFAIHANVWHFAPLSQNSTVNVFIIFNETTPEKDTVQVDLAKEFNIVLQADW